MSRITRIGGCTRTGNITRTQRTTKIGLTLKDRTHQKDRTHDKDYRTDERYNSYIDKITVLSGAPNQDHSKALMKWLADSVKPIMKRHNIHVKTFQEIDCNQTFKEMRTDGQYHFADKVLEIQLRKGPGREFQYYMSNGRIIETMLHELAHACGYDHGHQFREAYRQLKQDYIDMYGYLDGMTAIAKSGTTGIVTLECIVGQRFECKTSVTKS